MPRFAQQAKQLAAELRRLEAKDIKKQLQVNDAVAKQYEKSLAEFDKQQAVPASCLYDTPLFDSLDAASLDEDDALWANKHLCIFSGLYGLLRPYDEIQPLSLPVTLGTKLTTTKGKFLREYWREPVLQNLDERLRKLSPPVIVNCAQEADAQILDADALPEGTRIATVEFKIKDKDSMHEATGELLRWAMENRCMTFEDLLDFRGLVEEDEEAVYRVSPKGRKADTIVFEENVGEGGDGGWRKKMVDSGLGKKAFVKEFASGKDRWKRTDLNKAMAKKEKHNRKSAVFY